MRRAHAPSTLLALSILAPAAALAYPIPPKPLWPLTAEAAQAHMKEAIALLDRAATKRLLHPNRVARIKGQIARQVNDMSAMS